MRPAISPAATHPAAGGDAERLHPLDRRAAAGRRGGAAAGGGTSRQCGAGLLLGSQTMAMGELYAFTRARNRRPTRRRRLSRPARLVRGRAGAPAGPAAGAGDCWRWAGRTPISAPIRCRATGWNSSPTAWPAADRRGALPATLDAEFALVRAKLDAFIEPPRPPARYPETDAGLPARYARAIALIVRAERSGMALLAPMLRENPGNPWMRELQGQILFEAGRPRDSIAPLGRRHGWPRARRRSAPRLAGR